MKEATWTARRQYHCICDDSTPFQEMSVKDENTAK